MVINRKIRSLLRLIIREYNWYRDVQYCRGELSSKRLQAIPEGKKIVLMPHSDDEWIGCSQILMNQPEQVLVVNMDMIGGDDEELHRTRRKEAEFAAQKYGYRFVTVRDGINDLARILLDEQPNCVFLPSYLDWHEEHIAVMQLFKQAAMKSDYDKTVAIYQVSLPIPADLINCGYEMSHSQLTEKWSELKRLYPSQSFLPVRRFMLNEQINGGITSTYALEAYSLMNGLTWEQNLDKMILEPDVRRELKNHLQEIRFIRETLEERSLRIKITDRTLNL